MVKDKTRINRLNLWILIGICWLLPQMIILYFPEGLQMIKPLALLLLGYWVIFGKSLDKFLLENWTHKKKIKKKKKDKKRESIIFSRYTNFIIGIISLVIGSLHSLLFGFGWKNIPLLIIGTILLHSLVSEDKKKTKINGKKDGQK